jgi:hypothetical protein
MKKKQIKPIRIFKKNDRFGFISLIPKKRTEPKLKKLSQTGKKSS